jgi:single-strand DNA-binding protein
MFDLLEKGNEIMLQGKLSNRTYDDKDGNKQYITEVVAESFLKLEKKEKANLPF